MVQEKRKNSHHFTDLISFFSPEQDDFADDDEPVRRGAGVAGGRKASPAAKKSAISPPRGGGRNARRGPALAGDFAEDGVDDDDAALFGDEIDEGDALFVDEDDGLLGDDEPLFADEVGGGAGAVGGRRSKGAAAGSATMAGKKKNNRPGQKKTPLQPEPDFRSGGAKAPLVGAARDRGSSSDLTNAAAVGGAGRSRSNALPIAAATLDSRTNGRPASGTEDLDATAAANPLPRKLITSDLITMRNDDDMRVSADSASASASGTRNGNGNGKERSGNIAGVAATHKNFRSKIATADVAVAAQNAERKRTAVAVASGLSTFEAGANDADAAAAGSRGGGRASSAAAAAATETAGKTTAATSSTPPVVVALANRFYFGDRYARVVPGCTWRGGASLPCEFTSDQARFADADAMA